MRKSLAALCLACVFAQCMTARASAAMQDINRPVPAEARRLAMRGVEMAARDRAEEGVALLKRAISLAPNYVWAHERYFSVRTFDQGRYDEVRAEYDRLMAQQPDNPVYPLVVAETAHAPTEYVRALYERVVKLAPDWAWAHCARARLADEKELEVKVSELMKCTQQDETADAYYSLVYILEHGLGKIDDAISAAERWAAQPEHREWALRRLWQLRLAKAKESEDSQAALREELGHLVAAARDPETLSAARSAYLDLLKDSGGVAKAEAKLRRIDPTWYPERGRTLFIAGTTEGGIPRPLLVANRQFSVFNRAEQVEELEPKEKMARLEKLLSLGPGREMKIYIYQRLMRAAEKVKDRAAFVRYGEALRALEPGDTSLPAKIAIALTDLKAEPEKALAYASLAEKETAELRPAQRPRNTPPEWFAWSFPEARWRDNYKRQRALALDAAGWVLCRKGDYAAAETKLRASADLVPTERNLLHLSEALRGLGRADEAEAAARAANNVWLESLRRQFVSRPASDFQLLSTSGRSVRLSGLKGKVVVIDFWATWCGPCVQEMPHLVELYEKYRGSGLEVLAISVDGKSDLYKVAPFAAAHKMTFPVLFDEGVSALYGVKGYPTTVFVDRQGNVRYVSAGFDAERLRAMEAVIGELLKGA